MEEQKNEQKRGAVYFFKKYATFYISVLVIIFSLGVGFEIGRNTKESSQEHDLSKVSSKENQTPFSFGKLLNIPSERPQFLSKDVDFSLLQDVWQKVKTHYIVKDTPDTKLFYGALAGVVGALDDPYSSFFDPETAKKFHESLSGTFEGIGAEIGMKDNQLIIVAALDHSPAKIAGIQSGDKIVAIDKKSTTGMAIDYAVSSIRGKKGTPVMLTLYRSGEKKEREVTIIRDKIVVASVTWKVPDEQGIATIKISHFNDDTEKKFKEAVRDILPKHPKGLILDLRDDPGGFLDAAITVAGYWVNSNIVTIQKFSDGHQEELRSHGDAKLKNIPTVTLVNEGSASASEIVAGALQDYGISKLVGKKTYGKGSVQDLQQLKDGSSLKLTIALWFTPKGRSINKEGITPDTVVEMKAEDYEQKKDPQLDKAREMVLKK